MKYFEIKANFANPKSLGEDTTELFLVEAPNLQEAMEHLERELLELWPQSAPKRPQIESARKSSIEGVIEGYKAPGKEEDGRYFLAKIRQENIDGTMGKPKRHLVFSPNIQHALDHACLGGAEPVISIQETSFSSVYRWN